jgi:DNA polymerase-3 subunit epsilon
LNPDRPVLPVVEASDAEREAHQAFMSALEKKVGATVWSRLEGSE